MVKYPKVVTRRTVKRRRMGGMKSYVGTCRGILLRNGMGILSILFYKNIPNLY